jgi:hypothetical protein
VGALTPGQVATPLPTDAAQPAIINPAGNGQTWSAPAITPASTKSLFAKVHLSPMNKSDQIGVVQTFKGTSGSDEFGVLS